MKDPIELMQKMIARGRSARPGGADGKPPSGDEFVAVYFSSEEWEALLELAERSDIAVMRGEQKASSRTFVPTKGQAGQFLSVISEMLETAVKDGRQVVFTPQRGVKDLSTSKDQFQRLVFDGTANVYLRIGEVVTADS